MFGWLGFMAYQPLWVIQRQILLIYIYWIYTIRFGWVLWHINNCRLFNAKSSLYSYQIYMCKHILLITFLNEPELFFFLLAVQCFQVLPSNTNKSIHYQSIVCRQGSGYKYSYLTLIILFNTIRLFPLSNDSMYCYVIPIIQFRHSLRVSSIAI